MVLLDFRTEVDMIAALFKTGEFDAKTLSEQLMRIYGSGPVVSLEALRRVRPKQISNDLRRLRDMTFVRRRKIRRQVRTASGKTCCRGYEYKYQLTKQAISHIGYRAGILPESQPKGLEELTVYRFLEKKAPKEQLEVYRRAYVDSVRDRPGKRRFPGDTVFLDKVIEAKLQLERDEKIARLQARIAELEANLERGKALKKTEVNESPMSTEDGKRTIVPAVLERGQSKPTQGVSLEPDFLERLVRMGGLSQTNENKNTITSEQDIPVMKRLLEKEGYRVTGPTENLESVQGGPEALEEQLTKENEETNIKRPKKITLMRTALNAAKKSSKSFP